MLTKSSILPRLSRPVHRSGVAAALVIGGFLFPARGTAQPAVFGYRVSVPMCIAYSAAQCGQGRSDLRLYWDRATGGLDTIAPAGRIITRQIKVNGKTISYTDTLETALTESRDTFAVWVPGPLATVYVDSKESEKVHVNFWLPAGDSIPLPSGQYISTDTVRSIGYYFRLANRQTVRFKSRAWSVGATTIPFRVRPGYRAENGARIDTNIGTDANVNLYLGRTWGGVRYTYLRDADENPIRQDRAVTLGGFLGLSSVDVDSTTSRSATAPLSAKRSLGVVSPGLTGLVRIEGVEVGLFAGIDFGVGSGASRWDYHARPWFGLGLGFNLLKLGKSD